MSELCSSNSKRHFCSILISGVTHLFSFVLSHPLYFSYFVFFSPYILKLLHFLSPLLVTISLLLLAFVNEAFCTELSACAFMKHCPDEGFQGSDDLGMYEILFVPSVIMEVGENPVEFLEEKPEEDPPLVEIKEDLSIGSKIENFAVVNKVVINPADSNGGGAGLMEERRLKNFLKILDEFEKMASGVEDRKKKVVEPPTVCAKTDKAVVGKSLLRNGSEADESKAVVSNGGKDHHKSMVKDDEDDVECKKMASFVEERKKDEPPPIGVEVFDKLPVRNGSDAKESKVSVKSFANCNNSGKDDKKSIVKAHSQRISSDNNNLGNYGSMRKEKEWKRTLACKLFEERHNVDGGEGMDSLWEAYEINSSNGSAKKTNGNKNLKKNENKSLKKKKKSEIEIEIEEDEEEGINNGQLCCLQALNLSTKKMNLGIGRPNLVKISKAIKGIGWLHHVSKKVHNNNGDRY
ncbi:hypothetical protein MIMGU_mgv1a005985mg [Erythranthe guttata]|uniref:Uncharacterized protein n=1 Tax=Erythranthe guttata TaxID=4155 RepID=A0A022RG80_ERYGU|nr:PREDICTED: uncharacterized protein LOC105955983 [Erythranthe guttata]EYU39211.1 hypothetical protein MIMGU_mgv1a005985mg [Erythranthe guttata]|eukprot:XP_012835248.1 PREDICTED: uncharacterized protein LOC105955983 [Erythranthe guttata]